MDDIRILIADDQPLVRNGLRATLGAVPGLQIVAEASNGADAVSSSRALRPDLVLMDINMPVMSGLEATRKVTTLPETAATRVVILTIYDQDEHVFEALRAGASGFILKDAPTEQLVEAVRTVASGDALLSPSVTRRLVAEFARRPMLSDTTAPELAGLTDREMDMFKLLVRGYRNEDMARILTLGESTVKSHIQHLYQKLGVRDRVQVVIYAYENGLVQPGRGTESLGGTRTSSRWGRPDFISPAGDTRRPAP
ncbi:response regulator [Plantactinospora endophytica]|uniref:DNA-binding response regulator n=1 Tax=Plantactinospora endophytica TaxID=673535 RepID=A0ABQ4ECW1_9ACTN|nr:response regulator transcription factor [Plantactinospora endophytica]GIG92072.1 DNA-binding response regulator [Plantactinospora endophytica]